MGSRDGPKPGFTHEEYQRFLAQIEAVLSPLRQERPELAAAVMAALGTARENGLMGLTTDELCTVLGRGYTALMRALHELKRDGKIVTGREWRRRLDDQWHMGTVYLPKG